MVDINVMLHELVPEHILLSEKQGLDMLKKWNITADQLPKIRRDDPVVKVLEEIGEPIEEGRIIKIIRRSESAGMSVVYRMVVQRVK